MNFLVLCLCLVFSKVNSQINALASVLEFADSNDFDLDQLNVLERPAESKCECVNVLLLHQLLNDPSQKQLS